MDVRSREVVTRCGVVVLKERIEVDVDVDC